MEMERTKNASRNIFFGVILKLYQTLLPFIMRTVMIYFLGAQYLGLNSLFTSILQVLNLTELGVGSAMVYSMYKPIAEGDSTKICALMRLYKIYYRAIGAVILVIGLILLPFIPRLISGSIPEDMNVYILYLLNLCATVLTYWLFAYRNSILSAHQRVDVSNKVSIFAETVKFILQILALVLTHNYYCYVVVLLFTQALQNIVTACLSKRMYPMYSPKGKLGKEEIKQINGRIKDLFTAKFSGTIVSSADTIVISAFLGLTILAMYQNYYYIFTALSGFIAVIFGACTAGAGNSIITETKEKNFADFSKLTFLISWIVGFCVACLLCLYQPFMELWMGKDMLLDFGIVICICIYFFVYEINMLLSFYKDAAGRWHEDRFRPLVTSLINLALNLISVRYIGLYGIVLSTVISMLFVGIPWLLKNLFTTVFERKYLTIYLKPLLSYTIIAVIGCALSYVICANINVNLFAALVLRLLICTIVVNVLYIMIFRKTNEFKQSIELVQRMLRFAERKD